MKSPSIRVALLFVLIFSVTALGSPEETFLSKYKGTPFNDGHHNRGAQPIPGKVMCAYYDPEIIETQRLAEAAGHVQDWLDALAGDGGGA